ncbi:hypothetical protein Ddye_013972 [Dipteronia dyeriana]|uniref:Reverse transcriptase zinc-binding domain-containing protein n=1 Tax=Dipteronia dyeriana TaxID=168575 RepID=A0AAE0CK62_9ROSI|nr:hypothetical protein Ddye_013972 [Dipteronia dyeriana]
MKRRLIDWELVLWECFQTLLKCCALRDDVGDDMAWTLNSKGSFSMGSFRRCLEENGTESADISKVIWNYVCPKKVEIFVWHAIFDRIMVKDVWLRFSGVNAIRTVCQLCNKGEKSSDHLLLHCS